MANKETTVKDTCEYRLGQKIGEGGYGKVYVMNKVDDPTPYALKSVSRMRVQEMREIFCMSYLNHPNVVKFVDILNGDNCLYEDEFGIIMPLAKGSIESGKYQVNTSDTIRKLVYDLVGGLHAIHTAGILHLDIKPHNVLRYEDDVTGESTFVHADFGLCMFNHDMYRTTVAEVNLKVTAPYRAPEILPDKYENFHYDGKTDVFALGMTLIDVILGGVVPRMVKLRPTKLTTFYEEEYVPDFTNFNKSPWRHLVHQFNNDFDLGNDELIKVLEAMIADHDKRKTIFEIVKMPYFSGFTPVQSIMSPLNLGIHTDFWELFMIIPTISVRSYLRSVLLYEMVGPYIIDIDGKEMITMQSNTYEYSYTIHASYFTKVLLNIAKCIENDVEYESKECTTFHYFLMKILGGNLYYPLAFTNPTKIVNDVITSVSNRIVITQVPAQITQFTQLDEICNPVTLPNRRPFRNRNIPLTDYIIRGENKVESLGNKTYVGETYITPMEFVEASAPPYEDLMDIEK